MTIGATDHQQPRIHYEVIAGPPPPPEIILTRPLLDGETSFSSIYGPSVPMTSAVIPPQHQLYTQIPTKQYIPSAAGDMIKLEVDCTTAPSSTKSVLCQPTYVNNIIYPRFPLNGNNSKVYGNILPGMSHTMSSGRTLPIQQIPYIQENMRSQKFTDTAASVAMEFQSLHVTSNTELSNQKSNNQSSNQLEEVTLGNLHHTLTKVEVSSSGALKQPAFLPRETSITPLEDFERNTENCYTLMTNAEGTEAISMNSSILSDNQVTTPTISSINANHFVQGNQAYDWNDVKKVISS